MLSLEVGDLTARRRKWHGGHSGNHHCLRSTSLTVQVFANGFNDSHVKVIITILWDDITRGSLATKWQLSWSLKQKFTTLRHQHGDASQHPNAKPWHHDQLEVVLLTQLNPCYPCQKWISYSPGSCLCTHSSTVVCSSASVLANFSLRRLHSSALRSSSCCRSFKSATAFLSASFFWGWNTQYPYLVLDWKYSDMFQEHSDPQSISSKQEGPNNFTHIGNYYFIIISFNYFNALILWIQQAQKRTKELWLSTRLLEKLPLLVFLVRLLRKH